jgi:hypothetical protein
MRLILKYTFLSLTLFIFSFILKGCVDEPPVAPAYKLSSVIRVVNVSYNVDNIRVTIAGETPVPELNGLPIGSSTDFFDIPAGKKTFIVYNENNDSIYAKDIELSSLELITVFIAGELNQDEPLLSTFGAFDLAEGETYISHAPRPGYSNLYFVHASAPVDTFNSRKYRVLANINDTGVSRDTTYNATPRPWLEFSRSLGAETLPGEHIFRLNQEWPPLIPIVFDNYLENTAFGTPPVEKDAPILIEPGFRYYMFIYGSPNQPKLFVDKVVPPAIRPRD